MQLLTNSLCLNSFHIVMARKINGKKYTRIKHSCIMGILLWTNIKLSVVLSYKLPHTYFYSLLDPLQNHYAQHCKYTEPGTSKQQKRFFQFPKTIGICFIYTVFVLFKFKCGFSAAYRSLTSSFRFRGFTRTQLCNVFLFISYFHFF